MAGHLTRMSTEGTGKGRGDGQCSSKAQEDSGCAPASEQVLLATWAQAGAVHPGATWEMMLHMCA